MSSNGIFGVDSGLMRGLTFLSDMFLIGLLWLTFCLPIVTIGASTTAAYYAMMKVVHKKTGYITREFFKSFKMNFKDSLIFTVIYSVIGFLLVYNTLQMYYSLVEQDTDIKFYLMFAYFVLFLLLLALVMYTFPALSRYTMTRMKLFRFALYATFRHIFITILGLIAIVLSVALVLVFPPILIILPGLLMYVFTILVERILRKYMTKEMLDQWDGTTEL